MTTPETGVRPHVEQEPRVQLTLTSSQRDALLVAIRVELAACEKEVASLRESGLAARQDLEDYNVVSQLMSHLEEIQRQLTSEG